MPTAKRQSELVKSSSRLEDSISRLTVTATQATLQVSCRKVEADAHRTLAKLNETVGLSATQKLSVFRILVRGADDFHPSMLVAGAPAGELTDSAEDAICEILSPAQETILLEAQTDDTAWWDDTVARMELELDETPGATVTDTE